MDSRLFFLSIEKYVFVLSRISITYWLCVPEVGQQTNSQHCSLFYILIYSKFQIINTPSLKSQVGMIYFFIMYFFCAPAAVFTGIEHKNSNINESLHTKRPKIQIWDKDTMPFSIQHSPSTKHTAKNNRLLSVEYNNTNFANFSRN